MVGYCVRSCDGHYFPMHAQPGLSAAEACRSSCPAAKTQLYSGSSIDTAITVKWSRYVDLANAYLYRKQAVAGCSCNAPDTSVLSAWMQRAIRRFGAFQARPRQSVGIKGVWSANIARTTHETDGRSGSWKNNLLCSLA